MANKKHLAKLKQGVAAWNAWRDVFHLVPKLSGADLSGTDLSGANLSDADLSGTNLISANLDSANLDRANVNRASLVGANLFSAYLRLADLRGAVLDWADLRLAHLHQAKLRDASLHGAKLDNAFLAMADLRGAKLLEATLLGTNLESSNFCKTAIGWTTFDGADLSGVKGLEAVLHAGPSTIGIDAIYRSHGNIPLAFLRGAGVPENFIEYMGSLTGKALEFYSCFISHSTKDQEFANLLHSDLQNKGVRCWFAPHDIQAGKKIHEQIDEAIRRYERLLLILSTNSMKSPWVKTEIRKARKRETEEKRRVLFPVSIVPFTDIRAWESFYADEGIDLAEEIRQYYIPDFSDWKNHDSYTQGLNKLLGGLKAEGSKVT